MRVILEVAHLNKALSLVKGCVPAKSTLPLLQHILFRAEGSRVTVTALNMEREAEASVAAQMDEGGIVALPGNILVGIISRLPSGAQVSFVLNKKNNRVEICSGSAKYTLASLDATDFPTIAVEQENAVELDIPVNDLISLLSVNYAAARDIVSQPSLYGVRLLVKNNRLTSLAMDGKRLAINSVPLPIGITELNIMLPSDAVKEVSRILDELEEDTVHLSLGRTAQIVTLNFRLTFTTIDFESTDAKSFRERTQEGLDKLLKGLNGATTSVHPAVLKNALNRASVVYAQGLESYEPAIVETSESGLTLSLGSEGSHHAVEDVEAATSDVGKRFRLYRAYFQETLQQFPEDGEIDIHYVEAGRPIVFTSRKRPETVHLISPLTGKQ